MRAYPHEFSGGMRQRVVLAMALIGEPDVHIADEPTTALDVLVQKQVLMLLEDVYRRRKLAVLLITHDLAVVAGFADRVVVMYAGRNVEERSTSASSRPRLTRTPLPSFRRCRAWTAHRRAWSRFQGFRRRQLPVPPAAPFIPVARSRSGSALKRSRGFGASAATG
jgi:ABC-type glutathione transport system ATPase component